MRKIKFRGKTPQGKWVYGDLAKIDGKYNILTNPIKWIDGLEFTIDGEYEIIPETIGQFIGLKDADGVDIYEGDIKKCSLGTIYEVKWDDDNARFLGFTGNNTIIYVGREPKSLVISNIHDNPELIKQ